MKNKIFKYDFLIVGAGLIGSLTALALKKKKLKVLVIEDKNVIPNDQRTLAVNANSKEFLEKLGIWDHLKTKPQQINKIIIKDYINSSPLIFSNDREAMGNVIYNAELMKIARQNLSNLQILKSNIQIDLRSLSPKKITKIHNKYYSFKKIIISIGKKITSSQINKSLTFNNGDFSYVGFFKHQNDHNNFAYEFFNQDGPLAVLPSPYLNNKKSTFIFSTNKPTTYPKIKSLIKKNFSLSHGKILFDKQLYKFPVIPHITKYHKNYIYVGDSLKSIHPVAGQGWNLGVKDIQALMKLIDKYPLESEALSSIYYSRRLIENSLYFGFTSLINFLYENPTTFNNNFIRFGYKGLLSFKLLRNIFIKQAMGRLSLID